MLSAAGGGDGWVSHLTQTNFEYIPQQGLHAIDANGYAYQNLFNAGSNSDTAFLVWSPDGDLDNAQDHGSAYSSYNTYGYSASLSQTGYVYLWGSVSAGAASIYYGKIDLVNPSTRQWFNKLDHFTTNSSGSTTRVQCYQGIVDSFSNQTIVMHRHLNTQNYVGLYTSRTGKIAMPSNTFLGQNSTMTRLGAKPNYSAFGTSYPYGDMVWVSGRGGYYNRRYIGRVTSGGSGFNMPGKFYENFTTGTLVYNAQQKLAVDSSDNCYEACEYGNGAVGYTKFAPNGTIDATFVHEKKYSFSELGGAHQTASSTYDPDTGYIYISGCTNLASPLSGYCLWVFAVDTNGNYQGGCFLRLLGDSIFSYSHPAEVTSDSIYISGWGRINNAPYNQALMAKIPKDFSLQGATGGTNKVDFAVTNFATPTVTTPSGGYITSDGNPNVGYNPGTTTDITSPTTLSLSYAKKSL